MPLKEVVIGGHNVHCLKEIRFPTVTCSGRCVPRLRKRRCAGVRQGQRGDCAGYGGRRDYRWRGRCRHIDSTDVVVAATGKRDANQALATVIAGTDVLLGSESGMDCGAAIKRS